MSGTELTDEQIDRYSRHILLQEIGVGGQRKLLDSSALVVGAGGLGSPIIQYLAAAGVGRIGVVDGDVVELSNLQRQVIHGTSDIGRPKAVSAQESVAELNADVSVDVIPEHLTIDNVRQTVAGYDIVLDGCDNFPTRFLVADSCWWEKVPLVSGAVLRFEGQLMTIVPGEGNPCYRCFIPEPPPPGLIPSCQEAGVLGAITGVIGTLQVAEAVKVLLGEGTPLARHMQIYDALDCSFIRTRRSPDPECPVCSANPTITELVEYEVSCELDEEFDPEELLCD